MNGFLLLMSPPFTPILLAEQPSMNTTDGERQCEFSHLMSSSDLVRGQVNAAFRCRPSVIFGTLFCRSLRAMIAVDIIKERSRRPSPFIMSEIFALSSMAGLAFGLPAVRLFRLCLSGHPQGEIGHDEGKLTADFAPASDRSQLPRRAIPSILRAN